MNKHFDQVNDQGQPNGNSMFLWKPSFSSLLSWGNMQLMRSDNVLLDNVNRWNR